MGGVNSFNSFLRCFITFKSPEVGTQVPIMLLCDRLQYFTVSPWGPEAVRVTLPGNHRGPHFYFIKVLPELPFPSTKRLCTSRHLLFHCSVFVSRTTPPTQALLGCPNYSLKQWGESNRDSSPALPPAPTPSSLCKAQGSRWLTFHFPSCSKHCVYPSLVGYAQAPN